MGWGRNFSDSQVVAPPPNMCGKESSEEEEPEEGDAWLAKEVNGMVYEVAEVWGGGGGGGGVVVAGGAGWGSEGCW